MRLIAVALMLALAVAVSSAKVVMVDESSKSNARVELFIDDTDPESRLEHFYVLEKYSGLAEDFADLLKTKGQMDEVPVSYSIEYYFNLKDDTYQICRMVYYGAGGTVLLDVDTSDSPYKSITDSLAFIAKKSVIAKAISNLTGIPFSEIM